ncbi:MAG: CGNR zinc finger domain-containing protein [Actinomycetota bacterium]
MDEKFIDFVNGEWYDGHGHLDDRLLKPEWLKAFTRKWDLGDSRSASSRERLDVDSYFGPERGPLEGRAPARSSGALEELLELRGLLRGIVETIAAAREIPTHDINRLDGFLERSEVRYRIRKSSGELRLDVVPLVDKDDWLMGAIALSAAEFLASGDRERLKVCANPGCRWVFYDQSKNQSRRWCDGNLCGNLFKVRRYRSRQKR